METIKIYEDKIAKNMLPIDVQDIVAVYESYKKLYPDITDLGIFFNYIRNKMGSILVPLDEEIGEVLGWLRLQDGMNVYFIFDDSDDYQLWMDHRVYVYNGMDDDTIRLLNYLELSIFNFVTDRKNKCNYLAYNRDRSESIKFQYDGTRRDDKNQLVQLFNMGYLFVPIRPIDA